MALLILIGIPLVYFSFVFVRIYNDSGTLIADVEKSLALMDKEPSVILSSDNKVLYRVSSEYRDAIQSISEVPKTVRDATLAAEDKRFYEHKGVDIIAILRVLVTNAKEGRLAQGGSTLEMQLAKRLKSHGEKSFTRKLRDIALAMQMQKRLTKDQILVFYLNQVFYGNGAYGIKAAVNIYFGKRLDQLTVGEAALLARCVRRPSDENPYANLDAALRNRDVVLKIMLTENMIDEQEYKKAVKERPKLRPKVVGSGAMTFAAPYFVQYILATFKKDFPDIELSQGGYTIQTTLDSRIQEVTEREVANIVRNNRRRKVTTAAFVLMDADGKLLAMAGGVSFKQNQYNVVTQGHRQPGSSFKPFVYATALATDAIGPNDSISNERLVIDMPGSEPYIPKNSGGSTGGRYSVRSAIAGSINICAVRVIQATHAQTVVDYAHDVFGFKSPLDPVPSLALGSSAVSPLEMAQGYSVFMLKGDRATPYGISKIIGPDGSTLKAYGPNIAKGVLSSSVCEYMDGFLRAVVTSGTARRYSYMMPKNCRGKTGTTSNNLDAWFCGYSDNLVGIGWVGNEQYDRRQKRWVPAAMSSSIYGGTVTVQMWAKIMKKAYDWIGRDFQPAERKRGEEPAGSIETPSDTSPDTPKVDDGTTVDPSTTPPSVDPTNPNQGAQTGDTGTQQNPSNTGPDKGTNSGETTVDPAKSEGRTDRKEPKPTRKTVEYVEVEICADSHDLASAYCPETVSRRYEKGKQPKRRCRIHGPKN
jgi:penicillin-binding protein 1A